MKKTGNEEVEYKQKSGTAWSHSYLNQKPWHPLSYPNQRRKWIAEQQNAQKSRKAEEVAHEVPDSQCRMLTQCVFFPELSLSVLMTPRNFSWKCFSRIGAEILQL
jgi:hypothetical protein